MACATIHLAIAKKYLKRHPELNYEKVLAGALYPDTVENKDVSHYTDLNRGKDLISYLQGKVDLYAFLKEHDSMDDFELGWFLHLVTDYIFFSECFAKEYLANISYQEFVKDLYFAYDHINLYVSEKYHIIDEDYKAYPSENYGGEPYKDCILPKDMIDAFIERVASFDLDEYVKKIHNAKGNVKP